MTRFSILGLGEAGLGYASGLAAAGGDVVGFDPFVTAEARAGSLTQALDLAEALEDADVVLSLTGGRDAVGIARQAMPLLAEGTVFADLNTASVDVKQEIASIAAKHGVGMVDGAVLAPVPRAGHRTPLAASGPGAARFARLVAPFGVPVDVVGDEAGTAARLKLLRSVFMKGLGALVVEALGAAAAMDAESWLHDQITAELGPGGPALVERLVSGTRLHAQRREHEVRDALAALEATGRPTDMTRAALTWFERINDGWAV
ncbi:3-hydroxyisobutyrate dehydrogenase-like beta-hydroxyacid dehydrogenase [Brevibacterium sanguinis]|uniref:3-hydroxyisobutyrate dehydrogenase-like beta-hydroxyacid dehydrogenase n=2 Tax=Brevibacterium TaxID=1696 RepID=A0A366IJE5_9MICO|nr:MULTISPECIES: NAD(P)-dependent oxidoreductase [Brevibacterium]RBP65616.1 3-hydroxyisobutyrate dehydrogenase-like beta-hydroxyacid dehydrogenase [Brevibacterium sanguinis]RBP72250.1 3-hydroxyisobutyrate dehydrogenase-like beta-hydroxyacid dehydrogenase [Brevibacterium celere]